MRRLQGLLLLLAVMTGSMLPAQEQKGELTKEERAKLEAEAARLRDEGMQHLGAGNTRDADSLFRRALALREKLYPLDTFPDGHVLLAQSQSDLSRLLEQMQQFPQAEEYARKALSQCKKLFPTDRFPDGHLDVAACLLNLGSLQQSQGKSAQAEKTFRDALAMAEKLYPPERYAQGHPLLVACQTWLASLLLSQGKPAQAEPLLRASLRSAQLLYPTERFPDGHSFLAGVMNTLAQALHEQDQDAQAERYFRDTLAMRQKLYPPARYPHGHPELAISLGNLAILLQKQGKFTTAEPLCQASLAMNQKLYPPQLYPSGHPNLATDSIRLAAVYQALDKLPKAEEHFRESLAMRQKLYPTARYPDGHPELADALNALAVVLHKQGQLAAAEPLCRQALAMYERLYPARLYPDGHPLLANSLGNWGELLISQGRHSQAELPCRDALAMLRKLYPPTQYPDGHHAFANGIHALALLLHDLRRYDEAEQLYREGLQMYRRLMLTHAEFRSEGEVLTLLAAQPGTLAGFLSLLRLQPDRAAQAYPLLWNNRNALTRLSEQRHLAVRAAASPNLRKRWQQLHSLHRQRARLLLAPQSSDPATAQARDLQLEAWQQQIDYLSAQVREGLPALKELQRLDQSTPTDLQKAMPRDAVFVDLLRYTFFENDPKLQGKEGKKQSLRYVAFVVGKEQTHHVDLGPAETIETAVKLWRENITKKNAPPDQQSPSTLRKLLWEPLEKHFPAGTTTVFLCPDLQLCFLPWAALPGKKAGSVLLEDYTLATVPHGPYLLGQLQGAKEQEKKQVDLLVLGGVRYDEAPTQLASSSGDRGQEDPKAAPVQAVKAKWEYLPGTAQEAQAILQLAAQQKLTTQYLTGTEVGVERFQQELPKARIAHLATHGFFADTKFRSVLQMNPKFFEMRGSERVGAGALLPSLLSGLVFAGANRPETPGRGILTAAELFDLDLTGMELAVLSACETGLGDIQGAGGEGVFGLQRSLHVAGCQNVIASLWKVNDVATMVLMEEFYRNLWEKKLPKRESLRQAQLMVYRNPDLVAKRAEQMGVRGIEDEAGPLPADKPRAVRRSPPAWWAAFVLSGLGE